MFFSKIHASIPTIFWAKTQTSINIKGLVFYKIYIFFTVGLIEKSVTIIYGKSPLSES